MLEDLLPIIVDLIKAEAENKISVKYILDNLHSLERIYPHFDELNVISALRDTVVSHIKDGNNENRVNQETENRSLYLSQHRETMKLLDSIRQSTITGVGLCVRRMLLEPKVVIDMKPNKKLKKAGNKNSKNTFSFNLDDLEPFGMLSDIFQVWDQSPQTFSSVSEGLEKLLQFDTLDLIEHPQWPDLVQYLNRLIGSLSTIEDGNHSLLILFMALCHRYLTAYHPLHGSCAGFNPVQLLDILSFTLKILEAAILRSGGVMGNNKQDKGRSIEQLIGNLLDIQLQQQEGRRQPSLPSLLIKLTKQWIVCYTAVIKQSMDEPLTRLALQFFSQLLSYDLSLQSSSSSSSTSSQQSITTVPFQNMILYYYGRELLQLITTIPVYTMMIILRQTAIYDHLSYLLRDIMPTMSVPGCEDGDENRLAKFRMAINSLSIFHYLYQLYLSPVQASSIQMKKN